MPTNDRLRNLSLGTPPRCGVPYTRRGHIQTMSAWLSTQPLNYPPPVSALPATLFPATETCLFTFVASSSFSSIKKGGLQLLVDTGCSPHMVDPDMIPNADQHLREYQALQPPKIIEVTQPLELVYTDLSGTISPASGAGN